MNGTIFDNSCWSIYSIDTFHGYINLFCHVVEIYVLMMFLIYVLIEGERLNIMFGKDKWIMCFNCPAGPQEFAYHHINFHQRSEVSNGN